MNLQFIYSDNNYKLFDENKIGDWIKNTISNENKKVGSISYNFVSEEEILQINQEHLNHDYFTDIITFDDCFVNIINGDIFISPDTIKDNSQKLNFSFSKELFRVIIHGIMHLCGYNDHTKEEKVEMRKKEDFYLSYLE